jgi:DNA-binding NarL/FixJ family response regulator
MQNITVLLVDDHAIVRQGLRALLSTEPGIEVLGEVGDGRQAVQMAKKLQPNVVIMDIAMPWLNGVEATRQIVRLTRSKVLVLSCYDHDSYVQEVIEAGVSGYLVKQTASDDLLRAIREVVQGNAYFSPTIARRLSEHYRNAFLGGRGIPASTSDHLTTRESEVLQLIAEGRANKQIAAELGISIKTVEKHRQQLMNKLGTHNIAGLTRHALTTGVVESVTVLHTLDPGIEVPLRSAA